METDKTVNATSNFNRIKMTSNTNNCKWKKIIHEIPKYHLIIFHISYWIEKCSTIMKDVMIPADIVRYSSEQSHHLLPMTWNSSIAVYLCINFSSKLVRNAQVTYFKSMDQTLLMFTDTTYSRKLLELEQIQTNTRTSSHKAHLQFIMKFNNKFSISFDCFIMISVLLFQQLSLIKHWIPWKKL